MGGINCGAVPTMCQQQINIWVSSNGRLLSIYKVERTYFGSVKLHFAKLMAFNINSLGLHREADVVIDLALYL